MIDEFTDVSNKKLLAVLFKVQNEQKTEILYYKSIELVACDSQTIFKAIEDEFEQKNIP